VTLRFSAKLVILRSAVFSFIDAAFVVFAQRHETLVWISKPAPSATRPSLQPIAQKNIGGLSESSSIVILLRKIGRFFG
jgi:hypothetical protein